LAWICAKEVVIDTLYVIRGGTDMTKSYSGSVPTTWQVIYEVKRVPIHIIRGGIAMNRFDEIIFKELKAVNIRLAGETIAEEDKKRIYDTYSKVIELSKIARTEGLLSLEEACESLDMNGQGKYLFNYVMLIVDGTDPDMIESIGLNDYASEVFTGINAIVHLVFLKGALAIQEGMNPRFIEEVIKSMVPRDVRDYIIYEDNKDALPKALAEVEERRETIRKYCNLSEDKWDDEFAINVLLSKALSHMSDSSAQRLLRDVSISNLSFAMKILFGSANQKIFDNMSENSRMELAEDLDYMGPIRMSDAEEACIEISKQLIRLESSSEIVCDDLSTLKVAINMKISANKHLEEIKNKYKDLQRMIEDIYRA